MAWIESHQELRNHPKTRKAMRLLGVDTAAIVGHLHLLWWWALDYAGDSNLSGFENWEIAEAAMWDGDPNLFVEALAECGKPGEPGFIERIEGSGLILHDWHEYGGRLVEKRKANAERMRNARASNKEGSATHVHSTFTARAGATVQYSTVEKEDVDAVAEPPPKQKRKTRISPDFSLTAEMKEWAEKKGYAKVLDLEHETEEFVDYWRGRGTPMLDWVATWQSRIRQRGDQLLATRGGKPNDKQQANGPNLSGNVPPTGYAWEVDASGKWKPLEWSAETQSYPYGCETLNEALDITAQRKQEYIRARERKGAAA